MKRTAAVSLVVPLGCFRLYSSTTPRSSRVQGTVVKWVHERGFGHVMVEGQRRHYLVNRSGLGGGFYLAEGQAVVGIVKHASSKDSDVFVLTNVKNVDGKPILPKMIRGVLTQWNDMLAQGVITEKDLEGNVLPESPQFRLVAEDYACDHPPIKLGMPLLFYRDGNMAKRAVLDFVPRKPVDSVGRIREIRDLFGFVVDSATNESIYFPRSAMLASMDVGDVVNYRIVEEPPVSLSAGKKVAIALRPRR